MKSSYKKGIVGGMIGAIGAGLIGGASLLVYELSQIPEPFPGEIRIERSETPSERKPITRDIRDSGLEKVAREAPEVHKEKREEGYNFKLKDYDNETVDLAARMFVYRDKAWDEFADEPNTGDAVQLMALYQVALLEIYDPKTQIKELEKELSFADGLLRSLFKGYVGTVEPNEIQPELIYELEKKIVDYFDKEEKVDAHFFRLTKKIRKEPKIIENLQERLEGYEFRELGFNELIEMIKESRKQEN